VKQLQEKYLLGLNEINEEFVFINRKVQEKGIAMEIVYSNKIQIY